MSNKTREQLEGKTLERTATFARDSINTDERTVEIAFSSEEPYRRWFGDEILSHGKGAVDLSFLNSGRAPLLADHNHRDVIGIIEKAWIDKDRKGRALVRFGRGERASEFFNDVADGIRPNISVGYVVKNWKIDEEKTPEVWTATKWRPLENSVVAIPADETVGVGRSDEKETIKEKGIKIMADEKDKKDEVVDLDAVKEKAAQSARAEEMTRIKEISEMGKRRGYQEEAEKAINSGMSSIKFRDAIWELEENEREKIEVETVVEYKDIGLSKKELGKYSFLKLMRAQLDRRFEKDAGLEIEASRAAAEKAGTTPRGLIVPTDVLRRDLTAGTATDGAELVADNLLAGSFIDILTNVTAVMSLGATMLTDLQGDVLIPRMTSGASAGWVAAEGGDVSQSDAQFDQVGLTPRTLGVYTEASRQLLMQSSIDVENLIRMDFARSMGIAIDYAALYGSGASGQPTGIKNTTGINAPTDFVAAVPTYAEMVDMETQVAVDNALVGSTGYLINATMRGGLKTKEKATNTAQFVWEPGNTVNGYKTAVSNQVATGNAFFGNWADLLIGLWGGLDILVDPYTNSLSGTIRIVAHQSIDIDVRHPVSFAYNEPA